MRIPEAVVVADSATLQRGVARRAAVAVPGAWVLLHQMRPECGPIYCRLLAPEASADPFTGGVALFKMSVTVVGKG